MARQMESALQHRSIDLASESDAAKAESDNDDEDEADGHCLSDSAEQGEGGERFELTYQTLCKRRDRLRRAVLVEYHGQNGEQKAQLNGQVLESMVKQAVHWNKRRKDASQLKGQAAARDTARASNTKSKRCEFRICIQLSPEHKIGRRRKFDNYKQAAKAFLVEAMNHPGPGLGQAPYQDAFLKQQHQEGAADAQPSQSTEQWSRHQASQAEVDAPRLQLQAVKRARRGAGPRDLVEGMGTPEPAESPTPSTLQRPGGAEEGGAANSTAAPFVSHL